MSNETSKFTVEACYNGELVSDCCGAPVAEHRPEDTHARCNSCGEMAVIDKITEVARC